MFSGNIVSLRARPYCRLQPSHDQAKDVASAQGAQGIIDMHTAGLSRRIQGFRFLGSRGVTGQKGAMVDMLLLISQAMSTCLEEGVCWFGENMKDVLYHLSPLIFVANCSACLEEGSQDGRSALHKASAANGCTSFGVKASRTILYEF